MGVLTEVDCVVVSYNSAADLPACIDSLTSQDGILARVVVVDNHSCDDSVGTARQRACAVIVNDSNRGFAAAVNQGLRRGSAPWVLILNPDVRMTPGALAALLGRAQADATVGCVGPRTLDDDGTEYPSRRSFPTMMTAAVHGLLGPVWPANPATRRYHAEDTPRDQSSVVDWVSGSCMHSRGRSSRHRRLRSVLHHHVGAARFYWRSASRWHRPITWPLAVLVLAVRGAAQVSVGVLRAGR